MSQKRCDQGNWFGVEQKLVKKSFNNQGVIGIPLHYRSLFDTYPIEINELNLIKICSSSRLTEKHDPKLLLLTETQSNL